MAGFCVMGLVPRVAVAQEIVEYVTLPLEALEFEEGASPGEAVQDSGNRRWRFDPFLETRVRMGSRAAEAYVLGSASPWRLDDLDAYLRETRVAMRLPSTDAKAGTLWLALGDSDDLEPFPFTLPADANTEGARSEFLGARAEHYAELRNRGHAGAAWFRHLESKDRGALGSSEPRDLRRRFTQSDPGLYQLFSGGRAVAENLRLDRDLNDVMRSAELDLVARVDELEGIDVAEMDWSARLEGLTPRVDRLAKAIPADQHAVFFPNFGSFLEVYDAAKGHGLPLAGALDPRGGGRDLFGMYEGQLGVSLDQLARMLGAEAIETLAITGSDPFVRTGTDLGILFEPKLEAPLFADLAARQGRAAQAAGVDLERGEIGAATWQGAQTTDRGFSSYLLRSRGLIVLTNSMAQLERILGVLEDQDGGGSLASLDEYRWFRHRYALEDGDEDAFAFLSDPTIRRWSSPRWRIAAARRTRAAALLSSASAEEARGILQGGGVERVLEEEVPLPGGDTLWVGPEGVRSSTYGTLRFLTPIVELDFELVSVAEKDAYARFRDSYQRQWRTVFDPIGVRVAVERGSFDLDLTVLPLVGNSDYREFKEIAGAIRLDDKAGDPHPGTALDFALAVDRESRHFAQFEDLLKGVIPGKAVLGWVGDHVSLYADEDPFWEAWSEAEDRDRYLEENFYGVPVALHVDVRDPLRLAAFLVAARGFLDSITGDMLVWEPREHGEASYTRIGLDEDVDLDENFKEAALYYASTPGGWVLSMREEMIHRALDRRAASKVAAEAPDDGGPVDAAPTVHSPLLRSDSSVSFEISQGGLRAIELLTGDEVGREHLYSSWRNLDVLDSLARHFPDRDPVATYRHLFGTDLQCPSGGEYVFDPRVGGFASSKLGAPGFAPREVPLPVDLRALAGGAFSMTFEEDDGLRVRAAVRATER